jgi:hypothetical protein
MDETQPTNPMAILENLRTLAAIQKVRITQHAHQEMVEEGITFDMVLETAMSGEILENYPEHRRGACCLLGGLTKAGRHLHIVCTTGQSILVIITVYEPLPPKWVTPIQRSRKS